MEQISIELNDGLTIGALRTVARGMGKRLVISFADGAPRNSRRARKASESAIPANGRRRRRRKLSPEVRAKLAENLKKARAARSAKAKSRTATAKRQRKATSAKEATA